MVAPNAILNAGGRADEVRCYPGTREEVISKVERWISNAVNGICSNRIMWLSGPAGAGKSAICQTIAERCRTRRQQAASFFFFRGDKTRNFSQPLVPTLVYQLRRFYPMLDEHLTKCLTGDPLILKASIEDQFLHLISMPVQAVQQASSTHQTVVVVIDGLDECNDVRKQHDILVALRALADADQSPFLALIASRAEPNLIMAFNQLGTSVESIFLDEQYRPQDDIRRFVTAKFHEIKQVHHLRQMLDKKWPARTDINAIVDKSSGQFIYAATVMRFIQYSAESPDLSLVTILETQPSSGLNPLAQLDAVYSYIFSKVCNIRAVKHILCAHFITDLDQVHHRLKYETFLQLLGYNLVEIKSLFAHLGAIVQVHTGPVKLVFYHASLQDYLMEKWRSRKFHLDIAKITTELSVICLDNFHDKHTFNLATQSLNYVSEATNALSNALLSASTREISDPQKIVWVYNWTPFMLEIERLWFKTDREQFKILLRSWIRFAYLNGIDAGMKVGMENLSASWYYRWYHLAEGVKMSLKPNGSRRVNV